MDVLSAATRLTERDMETDQESENGWRERGGGGSGRAVCGLMMA